MEPEPREAKEAGGPPATPFDNPFFLPVLLAGFAVWFGYDGWFNPEMDWVRFNRIGALFCLVMTLVTGIRAYRERRARGRELG